jgi:hypothetical protein
MKKILKLVIRMKLLQTFAATFLTCWILSTESNAQTSILYGQTKLNQNLVAGQNATFNFSGTAGQIIRIQMTQVSGNFIPTFDLLGPNGVLLKTVSDPANRSARLDFFTLPLSGTYVIVCRDTPGTNIGGYNLTLIDCLGQNAADNERGELISGQPKTATLVSSDMDAFSFPGVVGEIITIQMSQVSGNFIPTFELLAPDGHLLKSVTDPATRSARLALFPLPVSGTFVVICRDTPGSNVGGYSLSFTSVICSDCDGDGLPDSWERQYFPDLSYGIDDDPDGDHLKNRDEFTKGTDPSKADTDGDGFQDAIEVGFGSDPLNINSKPTNDLRVFVHTIDVEFITLTGIHYQLQASRDFQQWENLGIQIQGDNNLFRTNIDVRGTGYNFFRAPAISQP